MPAKYKETDIIVLNYRHSTCSPKGDEIHCDKYDLAFVVKLLPEYTIILVIKNELLIPCRGRPAILKVLPKSDMAYSLYTYDELLGNSEEFWASFTGLSWR